MTTVGRYWKSHPMGCDTVVVLLLYGAFACWVEGLGGAELVREVLKNNRGSVYGAFVSIFGALLGFVITTMSIVLSWAHHEKFQALRGQRAYPQLWDIFSRTIRCLALATLCAVVALLVDRDASPARAMWHLQVFFSLFATARLYRIIWILELLIHMIAPHVPTTRSDE